MVAIAITVPIGQGITSAVIRSARSIADAAFVDHADTIIDIVTDAIAVRIRGTIATTDTDGVRLVSVAIAIAIRDGITSAIVNGTGTIAHATGVNGAHAIVHIVADAVTVGIGSTITAALAEGIVIQAVLTPASAGAAHTKAQRQRQYEEILIVTLREDLDIDRTGQVTVRGELTEQHPAIRVRKSIHVSIQDVPNTANIIIHDDVASEGAATRIESEGPILIGGIDHRSGALTGQCIRRTIDTDGDP